MEFLMLQPFPSRGDGREILFPTQPTLCLGKARLQIGLCLTQPFAVQHTGPFPIWSKTVRGTVGSASPLYIDLMNFCMLLIDIECWNDLY